ncbi:DUF1983 domain-containing protein [Dyella marensis]|uniref:phage tail fiber domain-containing protein n=1 Tax=Dyella marensis TaxID=500610 RepID=UPI0031DBE628
MAELARGYSFVMYTAKAGASYTIPFPYLHSDDIRVFAGDVGDAVEQSLKWLGPTEIQLAHAVPEGILVTLRRFSPRDRMMVTVKDGAQLPAADVNLNARQLLYIVQEQIDFGTYGGHGLPGGGSGWPNPGGSNPSLPIQQIIDQLLQSPVMQLLIGRIGEIDANANTLLQEVLRSDLSLANRHKDLARFAGVETHITTLVDDTQAMAMQITDIYAKFGGHSADILDIRQSVANEIEARTTAITQAKSEFDAKTQAINTSLQTTYATKDYAQSVSQQEVKAFANGNFAHLQQRFEAMAAGAADPDGKWSANWTVRINGGKVDGTPVIAGIGLGVDSQTGSNFVVMADRFAFVSPTYTSNGGVQQIKYPFVIGTVGGVSTVGIQGQLVVDGSITANKIKVNSLAALTANMGEVNGGTFRTFQLDANGGIINPTEFRVEMTNNPGDAYPLWVGSGVKNWNNAVFAMDRSGNAKFAGTIQAQNMIGTLQQSATWSWEGNMDAQGAVSPNFVLTSPVRLGEVQMPIIFLELSMYNSAGDPCNGVVSFERLVGGNWVTLKSQNYYLRSGDSIISTVMHIDGATSGDSTYRVRTSSGGNRDYAFHLSRITGYAFGLR